MISGKKNVENNHTYVKSWDELRKVLFHFVYINNNKKASGLYKKDVECKIDLLLCYMRELKSSVNCSCAVAKKSVV